MERLEHQSKTLKYVAVLPDGHNPQISYPLIFLLHGYGSNMHDLAGLAPSIDSQSYVYICPNAPTPVPIGPGLTGFAWTPLPGSRTADDMKSAEAMLSNFFDETMEQYHTKPGRFLLGGFSQGGMMTYQVGLPRPDLFAGLVILSGRVEDPKALEGRLPQERTQPLFIAHGTLDPLITVGQARQAKDFLESHGYRPSYHEYQMAHQITAEVLDDLVPWVHQTLPPNS